MINGVPEGGDHENKTGTLTDYVPVAVVLADYSTIIETAVNLWEAA